MRREPDRQTAAASAPREVTLDDAGRIAESLPCRACGYDLKGIAADGVCPECAGTVERSMRGDLLQYCEPTWINTLARGMLLVFIGTVGGVALQIGLMVTAMVMSIIAATAGGPAPMTTMMVTGGLLTAGVALLSVMGVWFVTTQDPGRTATEPGLSWRAVARYAIMASLVSAPMQMMIGQTGGFTGQATPGIGPGTVVLLIVTAATALAALVGWIAFYVHLRQLILRVPMPRLAKQTRIVLFGYAIMTAITMVFGLVSMTLVATGRLNPTGQAGGAVQISALVLGLGSCFGLVGFLLFEIWGAVVFILFRNKLVTITG